MKSMVCPVFVATIAAAGLLATSPANAKKKNPTEVREISNEYADCVVNKKTEMAREAILSNAPNSVIARKYRRLIISACILQANKGRGVKMSFGGDHYRYALAGALNRLDLKNHRFENVKDIPKLVHSSVIEPDPAMMARTDRKGKKYQEKVLRVKTIRALSEYGECIVRSDPVNSHALIMSEIGSILETKHFSELQSSFGPCLAGDGKVAFDKSVLRGLINVNYYRLAKAPMPTAVAVSNQTEAQN